MNTVVVLIAECRLELRRYVDGQLSLSLLRLPIQAIELCWGAEFRQYASSTTGECHFVDCPHTATDWDTQGESHAG